MKVRWFEVWSRTNAFPEQDSEMVYAPGRLNVDLSDISELTFDGLVVRTDTEWDSHYVRFAYAGINYVAELNFDQGPYVELQHDWPCVPIGTGDYERDRGAEVKCFQSGRREALTSRRQFDAPTPDGAINFWSFDLNYDPREATINFGRRCLGLGLSDEAYFEAGATVSLGLRDLIWKTDAPWWPVWNARDNNELDEE